MSLRTATIRLAYERPELRAVLLPLLTKQAAPVDPTLRKLIEQFRDQIEATVVEHYTKTFPTLTAPTITLEWGPRYVKIVKTDNSVQNSVFGFIDLTNGDILKAASWKAPAKGARGNLYRPETWKGSHGPYGMTYFR